MRLHNFDVDDIAHIDIDVPHHSWTVVCIPEESKWNPQTIPECQFSLPYTVATAAYEKDFFLEAFTEEARARQDVRELMTRIHAKEDPSMPLFSSRVNVTLKNGETCAKEYYYFPEGQPKVVMTEAQLVDKFRKCVPYAACKLGDNAVNSVIDAILNLERVDDIVDALLVPFTPS
jgi:2-methylcitrate dehydratase PrpD